MALMPFTQTCVNAVKPKPSQEHHHGKQRRTRKIKLESTAGTGHFYTTSKNKKTMPEKMSIIEVRPQSSQAR